MITSEDLQFILALASEESLAATARTLNVSPPSVSQRLSGLEKRLGLRLVERKGRSGLMLTTDCERLVEKARPILAELDKLSSDISLSRNDVVGHIRVYAPFGFGREHIAPAVTEFMKHYPQTTFELMLSDRLSVLPDRPWDIIIRVGQLSDSSLIAISLAENDRLLCASPTYIAEHGSPTRPEDLSKHSCLAIREDDENITCWTFIEKGANESEIAIRLSPAISSNDGEIVRSWALAGLGIMQRSEWSVAEDIKAGRLVHLLSDYRLPSAPVVALVSNRYSRAARVQKFIDHLRDSFSSCQWSGPGSV